MYFAPVKLLPDYRKSIQNLCSKLFSARMTLIVPHNHPIFYATPIPSFELGSVTLAGWLVGGKSCLLGVIFYNSYTAMNMINNITYLTIFRTDMNHASMCKLFNGIRDSCSHLIIYRVAQKMAPFFWYAITLPNVNRFSKFFHCQSQEKICNNTVAKDPTTPQVCRYTTLWNVSAISVP